MRESGSFIVFQNVGIVMELCHTDLRKLIEKYETLHSLAVLDLMLQMADASEYLGLKSIIHRDIKPGNILIKWEKPNETCPVYKLADFGCVRHFKTFPEKSMSFFLL